MALGDRIRDARERAGMTQDELAQALRRADERLARTSEKYVSLWENGAPRITFYIVDAIAQVTAQPLDFFSERSATRRERGARPVDAELVRDVRALQRAADDLARRLEEDGNESQ
jgi:transcriptional regulator with XRE-family HTH domain